MKLKRKILCPLFLISLFLLDAEGYLCSQIPMHYEILLQE